MKIAENRISSYRVNCNNDKNSVKKIPISKIAAEAGVSLATVSRVLNRRPGVSPELEEAVQSAIRRNGGDPIEQCRPASDVRKLRYGTVALLLLAEDCFLTYSSVAQKSFHGVICAAKKNHLACVYSIVSSCDELPPVVRQRKVDGLILAGQTPDPALVEALAGFPACWITSHSENGDSALAGNDRIARLALEYLTGRGHRRLAYVNALPEITAIRTRGEYFQFFAGKAGIQTDFLIASRAGIDLSAPEPDLEALERSLEALIAPCLTGSNRPTGLFVPMDFQTALLYRILPRFGLQPGRDLEIVSCDGEFTALAGLSPRPATIEIPGEAIGRQAVEQLLLRLTGSERNPHRIDIVIEPRLVPGDAVSCRFGA